MPREISAKFEFNRPLSYKEVCRTLTRAARKTDSGYNFRQERSVEVHPDESKPKVFQVGGVGHFYKDGLRLGISAEQVDAGKRDPYESYFSSVEFHQPKEEQMEDGTREELRKYVNEVFKALISTGMGKPLDEKGP